MLVIIGEKLTTWSRWAFGGCWRCLFYSWERGTLWAAGLTSAYGAKKVWFYIWKTRLQVRKVSIAEVVKVAAPLCRNTILLGEVLGSNFHFFYHSYSKHIQQWCPVRLFSAESAWFTHVRMCISSTSPLEMQKTLRWFFNHVDVEAYCKKSVMETLFSYLHATSHDVGITWPVPLKMLWYCVERGWAFSKFK